MASISLLASAPTGTEGVLAPEAVQFVGELVTRFSPRVDEILAARRSAQARFDKGERPRHLDETAAVRDGEWTVAPLPADLHDRRVEITGPVDRKMIINGLNSGANAFMADFEDASAPTWSNVVGGQRNLVDAVRGTIEFEAPETGKHYRLGPQGATLLVRPRGWHLPEAHAEHEGRPVPAALFDFGLFFFWNARELVAKGSGPYFYLPKLEGHQEARLWNDVFLFAQERLGLPAGTIKATVLIETLPAAFEMDEILWELRQHAAGLNCGRWDYIFSTIKTLRSDPAWVMPDRSQVTMDQPFLRAYADLLVKTCHRRRAHAMGGMAAQIPLKDPEQNAVALEKVRADKRREVRNGHDGTWVAHPALVPVAREIFDAGMPGPNQLHNRREELTVTPEELLRVPEGQRTELGLRHNVRVGVLYLEAWLGGQGCVPLYGLMEDAATAEISRAQVWQWLHHGATVGSEPLTAARLERVIEEELQHLRDEVGAARFEAGRFRQARALFERVACSPVLEDFLVLPAYEQIVSAERSPVGLPSLTLGTG